MQISELVKPVLPNTCFIADRTTESCKGLCLQGAETRFLLPTTHNDVGSTSNEKNCNILEANTLEEVSQGPLRFFLSQTVKNTPSAHEQPSLHSFHIKSMSTRRLDSSVSAAQKTLARSTHQMAAWSLPGQGDLACATGPQEPLAIKLIRGICGTGRTPGQPRQLILHQKKVQLLWEVKGLEWQTDSNQ